MKKPFAVRSDKMAGRKAFIAGVKRAQCPYPSASIFATYWLKGWDEEYSASFGYEKLTVADKKRQLQLQAHTDHNRMYEGLFCKLLELGINPCELRDFLKDMPE